jgi:hypothetical protein
VYLNAQKDNFQSNQNFKITERSSKLKKSFVLVAVFSFGYVANDLANNRFNLVPLAQAEVAGMDYHDLRRDRDFKKAVQRVVSGNCYVDDDTIYC